GLSLGIAPAAAWIAVRGSLSLKGVLLTAIVLLWVGGFDVLFACQDFEHDRRVGLYNVPQVFCLRGGFWIARIMHAGMAVLLFVMVGAFGLGPLALVGVVVCVALLAYEHSIVAPGDLRRLNA